MYRFVLTEDGRVLRFGSPGEDWLKELVNGAFVKPTRPVYGSDALDGTPLTEEDVSKMLKSGS